VASNGQITLIPGNYDYNYANAFVENLNISPTSVCCADTLTIYGWGQTTYSFTLPTVITPTLNTTWGMPGAYSTAQFPSADEYDIYNVPMDVSPPILPLNPPTPVPEPPTLLLLGSGLVAVVFLFMALEMGRKKQRKPDCRCGDLHARMPVGVRFGLGLVRANRQPASRPSMEIQDGT
jgi:hypothetical protein